MSQQPIPTNLSSFFLSIVQPIKTASLDLDPGFFFASTLYCNGLLQLGKFLSILESTLPLNLDRVNNESSLLKSYSASIEKSIKIMHHSLWFLYSVSKFDHDKKLLAFQSQIDIFSNAIGVVEETVNLFLNNEVSFPLQKELQRHVLRLHDHCSKLLPVPSFTSPETERSVGVSSAQEASAMPQTVSNISKNTTPSYSEGTNNVVTVSSPEPVSDELLVFSEPSKNERFKQICQNIKGEINHFAIVRSRKLKFRCLLCNLSVRASNIESHILLSDHARRREGKSSCASTGKVSSAVYDPSRNNITVEAPTNALEHDLLSYPSGKSSPDCKENACDMENSLHSKSSLTSGRNSKSKPYFDVCKIVGDEAKYFSMKRRRSTCIPCNETMKNSRVIDHIKKLDHLRNINRYNGCNRNSNNYCEVMLEMSEEDRKFLVYVPGACFAFCTLCNISLIASKEELIEHYFGPDHSAKVNCSIAKLKSSAHSQNLDDPESEISSLSDSLNDRKYLEPRGKCTIAEVPLTEHSISNQPALSSGVDPKLHPLCRPSGTVSQRTLHDEKYLENNGNIDVLSRQHFKNDSLCKIGSSKRDDLNLACPENNKDSDSPLKERELIIRPAKATSSKADLHEFSLQKGSSLSLSQDSTLDKNYFPKFEAPETSGGFENGSQNEHEVPVPIEDVTIVRPTSTWDDYADHLDDFSSNAAKPRFNRLEKYSVENSTHPEFAAKTAESRRLQNVIQPPLAELILNLQDLQFSKHEHGFQFVSLIKQVKNDVAFFSVISLPESEDLNFFCKLCSMMISSVQGTVEHLSSPYHQRNAFNHKLSVLVVPYISLRSWSFLEYDVWFENYLCSVCEEKVSAEFYLWVEHFQSETHHLKFKAVARQLKNSGAMREFTTSTSLEENVTNWVRESRPIPSSDFTKNYINIFIKSDTLDKFLPKTDVCIKPFILNFEKTSHREEYLRLLNRIKAQIRFFEIHVEKDQKMLKVTCRLCKYFKMTVEKAIVHVTSFKHLFEMIKPFLSDESNIFLHKRARCSLCNVALYQRGCLWFDHFQSESHYSKLQDFYVSCRQSIKHAPTNIPDNWDKASSFTDQNFFLTHDFIENSINIFSSSETSSLLLPCISTPKEFEHISRKEAYDNLFSQIQGQIKYFLISDTQSGKKLQVSCILCDKTMYARQVYSHIKSAEHLTEMMAPYVSKESKMFFNSSDPICCTLCNISLYHENHLWIKHFQSEHHKRKLEKLLPHKSHPNTTSGLEVPEKIKKVETNALPTKQKVEPPPEDLIAMMAPYISDVSEVFLNFHPVSCTLCAVSLYQGDRLWIKHFQSELHIRKLEKFLAQYSRSNRTALSEAEKCNNSETEIKYTKQKVQQKCIALSNLANKYINIFTKTKLDKCEPGFPQNFAKPNFLKIDESLHRLEYNQLFNLVQGQIRFFLIKTDQRIKKPKVSCMLCSSEICIRKAVAHVESPEHLVKLMQPHLNEESRIFLHLSGRIRCSLCGKSLYKKKGLCYNHFKSESHRSKLRRLCAENGVSNEILSPGVPKGEEWELSRFRPEGVSNLRFRTNSVNIFSSDIVELQFPIVPSSSVIETIYVKGLDGPKMIEYNKFMALVRGQAKFFSILSEHGSKNLYVICRLCSQTTTTRLRLTTKKAYQHILSPEHLCFLMKSYLCERDEIFLDRSGPLYCTLCNVVLFKDGHLWIKHFQSEFHLKTFRAFIAFCNRSYFSGENLSEVAEECETVSRNEEGSLDCGTNIFPLPMFSQFYLPISHTHNVALSKPRRIAGNETEENIAFEELQGKKGVVANETVSETDLLDSNHLCDPLRNNNACHTPNSANATEFIYDLAKLSFANYEHCTQFATLIKKISDSVNHFLFESQPGSSTLKYICRVCDQSFVETEAAADHVKEAKHKFNLAFFCSETFNALPIKDCSWMFLEPLEARKQFRCTLCDENLPCEFDAWLYHFLSELHIKKLKELPNVEPIDSRADKIPSDGKITNHQSNSLLNCQTTPSTLSHKSVDNVVASKAKELLRVPIPLRTVESIQLPENIDVRSLEAVIKKLGSQIDYFFIHCTKFEARKLKLKLLCGLCSKSFKIQQLANHLKSRSHSMNLILPLLTKDSRTYLEWSGAIKNYGCSSCDITLSRGINLLEHFQSEAHFAKLQTSRVEHANPASNLPPNLLMESETSTLNEVQDTVRSNSSVKSSLYPVTLMEDNVERHEVTTPFSVQKTRMLFRRLHIFNFVLLGQNLERQLNFFSFQPASKTLSCTCELCHVSFDKIRLAIEHVKSPEHEENADKNNYKTIVRPWVPGTCDDNWKYLYPLPDLKDYFCTVCIKVLPAQIAMLVQHFQSQLHGKQLKELERALLAAETCFPTNGIKNKDWAAGTSAPENLFHNTYNFEALQFLSVAQTIQYQNLVKEINYQINYFSIDPDQPLEELKVTCTFCGWSMTASRAAEHIYEQEHLLRINDQFERLDVSDLCNNEISHEDWPFLDFDTCSQTYICTLCNVKLTCSIASLAIHCQTETHQMNVKESKTVKTSTSERKEDLRIDGSDSLSVEAETYELDVPKLDPLGDFSASSEPLINSERNTMEIVQDKVHCIEAKETPTLEATTAEEMQSFPLEGLDFSVKAETNEFSILELAPSEEFCAVVDILKHFEGDGMK